MTKSTDLWSRHVLQWNNIGSPLRPAAQDIEIMQRLVATQCSKSGRTSTRAILLGVTPEIAKMQWPPATKLLAFDRNPSMIANVWPGNELTGAVAECANWTNLPVADHSSDVVIGDGCFVPLRFPESYHTLNREIGRVLTRDGSLVVRFIVKPDKLETVATVFDDLASGRIGNFHVFKWRLAMALQDNAEAGVRLADIWNVWNETYPDPLALTHQLNWPIETIRTIDNYREVSDYFAFPTLRELRDVLSPLFVETSIVYPDYELSQRCPIIQLRPN